MRRGVKLFVRRIMVLGITLLSVLISYGLALQLVTTLSHIWDKNPHPRWGTEQVSTLKSAGDDNQSSTHSFSSTKHPYGFLPAYPYASAVELEDGYPPITIEDVQRDNANFMEVLDELYSGKRKAFMKGSKMVRIRKKDGEEQTFELPICSDAPTGLRAFVQRFLPLQGSFTDKSMITAKEWLTEGQLAEKLVDIGPGGSWRPEHCIPRSRIAIIIPFRNRTDHLPRILSALIPMLKRQLLDFRIIVVEQDWINSFQYGDQLFNKGRLLNAAFSVAETMKLDCVIFHDVDLFPNDDRNPYSCPMNPRHIGAFVDTLGYELLYFYLAGGVLAIRVEQFRRVNGYSNMYWGWGGEDDDIGKRILRTGMILERPDSVHGRMTMLKHDQRTARKPSLIDKLVGNATNRMMTDGLTQNFWRIVKISRRPLYYHLYVDVGVPPAFWNSIDPTVPSPTLPPKISHLLFKRRSQMLAQKMANNKKA